MFKILFFNPPSRKTAYLQTNVHVDAPSYPNLTLAKQAGLWQVGFGIETGGGVFCAI